MKKTEYILPVTYFPQDFPEVWIHCPHAPNKHNLLFVGDHHEIFELERYIKHCYPTAYIRFKFIGERLSYPYCVFNPWDWQAIGKSGFSNYIFESWRYHPLYEPRQTYPREVRSRMIFEVTGRTHV